MKKWLFAILLGVVLVLGACGGDNNSDNNAASDNDNTVENEDNGGEVDSTAAEEVFKSNCASCHGQDLEGSGSIPALTTVGSDHSAEEIADIIENGTDGGMPAGLVSGDDVDLLANWLAEMK